MGVLNRKSRLGRQLKRQGGTSQVSIYPLRQPSLSSMIDTVIQVFQEHGDVQPGSMSSLLTGDDERIFAAQRDAFARRIAIALGSPKRSAGAR